jgi:hypothetical protein
MTAPHMKQGAKPPGSFLPTPCFLTTKRLRLRAQVFDNLGKLLKRVAASETCKRHTVCDMKASPNNLKIEFHIQEGT